MKGFRTHYSGHRLMGRLFPDSQIRVPVRVCIFAQMKLVRILRPNQTIPHSTEKWLPLASYRHLSIPRRETEVSLTRATRPTKTRWACSFDYTLPHRPLWIWLVPSGLTSGPVLLREDFVLSLHLIIYLSFIL